MPMKKRKLPKRRKGVKLSPWQRKCSDLYNRLQDGDCHDVALELAAHLNVSYKTPKDLDYLATYILCRFDATVNTLQLNYDHECVTFRVCLSWRNKYVKPQNGYLLPTLYVVKTSTSLGVAAMLSYIEICKHARRWI